MENWGLAGTMVESIKGNIKNDQEKQEYNKVKVSIYGADYTLKAALPVERLKKIAEYVNEKTTENAKKVGYQGVHKAAVLTNLNLAYEVFKKDDEVNRLRGELDRQGKDSSQLREELHKEKEEVGRLKAEVRQLRDRPRDKGVSRPGEGPEGEKAAIGDRQKAGPERYKSPALGRERDLGQDQGKQDKGQGQGGALDKGGVEKEALPRERAGEKGPGREASPGAGEAAGNMGEGEKEDRVKEAGDSC